MTCRTTHHADCECHELRHAEEVARLTRERDATAECESAQRTRAKDAERERDHARHERNVFAARVETYSAEAARLRGEVQRLATERARADHFAALLEAQGKELERMRIELANVTADRDEEHTIRRDYEASITFETSCLYCARMLSACRTADERAERAEAIIEGRTMAPTASNSKAFDDPFDDVQPIRLPSTDRMYAAVIERARQIALGEEPDDFATLRKIDTEKKR
jgi:hypothetical protein